MTEIPTCRFDGVCGVCAGCPVLDRERGFRIIYGHWVKQGGIAVLGVAFSIVSYCRGEWGLDAVGEEAAATRNETRTLGFLGKSLPYRI